MSISKSATLYNLRFSFASYLSEQETDMLLIEEWLGHNVNKTTLLDTNFFNNSIRKIKSPLDCIL